MGTSKQFLHHSANFIFLDPLDHEVVVITGIWRAISMSGHAAQLLSFKKFISKETLFKFNWLLSHVRNIVVTAIFAACLVHSGIRRGFGKSAVGELFRDHLDFLLISCYRPCDIHIA
jgi:hypothetical protein